MIPTSSKQILVTESWDKIYQSFKNADFQSYDFDTLRRTMISYLQETYPEDFNDYIDSSEYIALIDLIAFLGQNLSFRIDLNARENFLETAQRRDSILRLAQLISYNTKRNIPASGLLKITSVRTTDSVIDSNGINLANQIVIWNDNTNENWYQQFISILNSAMPGLSVFGNPTDKSIINGIDTEQYQINYENNDLPVFAFNKSISGIPMNFEVTGATFSNKSYIYEQPPLPGSALSYVFQNDNKGAGSPNTGFFVFFKQGSMASSPFSITSPTPNEIIAINANGINNSDVWLWQLNNNGSYQTLWNKVDALSSNNVIYNNLSSSDRKIYAVTSRNNDQIDLNFADGTFGDLPAGNFRLFYRQSNGLTYSITPDQLSGINVTFKYVNKSGVIQQLSLTLSLQYTVNNSRGSESNESIKQKAPQNYYLQNRMITAEDYNIGPLTVSNNVLKVKSINRISSGVSKYFELKDVSGKYSSTDIFADDGILYKEYTPILQTFKFQSRNQVFAYLKNSLSLILKSGEIRNFYFNKYPRPSFSTLGLSWVLTTNKLGTTTGYFKDNLGTPIPVGFFSNNNASYITPGALIKFNTTPLSTPTYVWSKVMQVIGDGNNNGKGNLNNGTGPIVLSDNIPNNSVPIEVIPAFITSFSSSLETQISNLCVSKRNFGLSFDRLTRQWGIIVDSNLDEASEFSLTYQQDVTNTHKDSSWMIKFIWDNDEYNVTYRVLSYIFESANKTAFYVENSTINYDFSTDTVVKDRIDILSINKNANLSGSLEVDYKWQIDKSIVEIDGYVNPKKVVVNFYDIDNQSGIKDPDAFDIIVGSVENNSGVVYFEIDPNTGTYSALKNQDLISSYSTETDVNLSELNNGDLIYFLDTNVIKRWNIDNYSFELESKYFAKIGRGNLKFHYLHNSPDTRRIDPSKSNIIDIYVLTSTYDSEFRQFLSNKGIEPLPPTSASLENDFKEFLEPIKSISDSIIYQPAKYKVLFGPKAHPKLQATFKAVKNSQRTVSDNDLKSRILSLINEFFNIDNWDFGKSFNFSELSAYVLNAMTPDIINFVIVPKNPSVPFGSFYEIKCDSHEILVSGTTADDIDIIDALTMTQLNLTSPIINSTNASM